MRNFFKKIILLILIITAYFQHATAQPLQKNRVIILSDIEADADDQQSFIRLLLYANAIDIKGMVATTSTHQKNNIYPQSIQKIVAAYAKVQPNLLKHEQGYPTASIDPSLFFDDNGKAYITYNSEPPENKSLYNGHRTIRLIEYDIATQKTVGDNKVIVNGGTDISFSTLLYYSAGSHAVHMAMR